MTATLGALASFDAVGFFAALDDVRSSKHLSWAKLADLANVDMSALLRLARGESPTAEDVVNLVLWSGIPVEHYARIATNHKESGAAATKSRA